MRKKFAQFVTAVLMGAGLVVLSPAAGHSAPSLEASSARPGAADGVNVNWALMDQLAGELDSVRPKIHKTKKKKVLAANVSRASLLLEQLAYAGGRNWEYAMRAANADFRSYVAEKKFTKARQTLARIAKAVHQAVAAYYDAEDDANDRY